MAEFTPSITLKGVPSTVSRPQKSPKAAAVTNPATQEIVKPILQTAAKERVGMHLPLDIATPTPAHTSVEKTQSAAALELSSKQNAFPEPQCLFVKKGNTLLITVPRSSTYAHSRETLSQVARFIREHPKHLPPLKFELRYLEGDTTRKDARTFFVDLMRNLDCAPFLNTLYAQAGAYNLKPDHPITQEELALCRDLGTLLSASAMGFNERGAKIGHVFSTHFYVGLAYLLQLKRTHQLPQSCAAMTVEQRQHLCLLMAMMDPHGVSVNGSALFDVPETLLQKYEEAADTELFNIWRLFNALADPDTIRKHFPSMEEFIVSPMPPMPEETMHDCAERFRRLLTPQNKAFIDSIILDEASKAYGCFLEPLFAISQGVLGFVPPKNIAASSLMQGGFLQALVQEDPEIEDSDEEGCTALMRAVCNGQIDRVEKLLAAGANVNAQSNNGFTPLMFAAKDGRTKLVHLLIAAGAEVQMYDDKGNTALIFAAATGKSKTVRALIKAGSPLEARNQTGETALNVAARKMHTDIVQQLAAAHADIETYDVDGNTPLTWAIEKACTPMITTLEEKGADADDARQFLAHKMIAHIWGIGGTCNMIKKGKKRIVNLEGMDSMYSMHTLSECLQEFFKTNKTLKKAEKREIQDAIDHTISAEIQGQHIYEDALSRIKSGKPQVIMAGWTGHCISIVLYKNQIAICNRQANSGQNAVEFYSLPKEFVTKSILKNFSKEYDNKEEFDEMFTVLCSRLSLMHLGGYHQKEQKVGNCTFASAKGAVGILFSFYAHKGEGAPTRSLLYKSFTADLRQKKLTQYVLTKDPNIEILQSIEEKWKQKSSLQRVISAGVTKLLAELRPMALTYFLRICR